MKAQSLHALIIDRHLGELPPEVAELLDAHLAQNPAAQAEAERVRRALDSTEKAVQRHPELASLSALQEKPEVSVLLPASPGAARTIKPRQPVTWLAWAAMFAALISVSGVAGFYAGRTQSDPAVAQTQTIPPAPVPAPTPIVVASVNPTPPRADRPWANYRLAQDSSGGGLRVVRIDARDAKRSILR